MGVPPDPWTTENELESALKRIDEESPKATRACKNLAGFLELMALSMKPPSTRLRVRVDRYHRRLLRRP
jgi:hypothetical protein